MRYLLCFLLLSVSPVSAHATAELVDAVRAVYKVGVRQSDGTLAIGSAVLVAAGKLITSCHTTRQATRIQILHPQGELPARAGRSDVRRDLCLLLVPELRGPVVERAPSSSLQSGQRVIAVGFGIGYRFSAQEGEVTALLPFDGANVVRTSAVFPRGASGGGLFDERGRLVGILTFRGSGDDALNYALPVEWVDALLDSDASSTPYAADKVAFWEDEAVDQPKFLQASWLLHKQAWRELESVALDWTLDEGENPEAWLALGQAKLELGQFREAALALKQAISLSPAHRNAWYWLTLAYHRTGFPMEFMHANTSLSKLDETLAAQLENLLLDRAKPR